MASKSFVPPKCAKLTFIAFTALISEQSSLLHIGTFLRDAVGIESSKSLRSGASNKRRKRQAQRSGPYHALFPPTPLDQLVTDNMSDEGIWTQLEFRGQAIENALSNILISTGALPEDEEDEEDVMPHDEASKKIRSSHGASEELVSNLSQLSDAELRAIGVNPEHFAEASDADSDYHSGPDGDEDGDGEKEVGEGYPGASDLSSDEDADDYEPGASKRVYFEPLRTEKEQRRKKDEDERRDMERARKLSSLRDKLNLEHDDEVSSEEEDEEDEEDDEGEEDEESAEDDEDEYSTGGRHSRQAKTLLDSLDDEDDNDVWGQASRLSKGPLHSTLDDQFFSIEKFNRETEEAERREILKEAGGPEDDEEDEIDLFQNLDRFDGVMDLDAEDEAGPSTLGAKFDPSKIRYPDFFEPAAGSESALRGSAQKRTKCKGKGSRPGQGAKLAKQDRDAARLASYVESSERTEVTQIGTDDDIEELDNGSSGSDSNAESPSEEEIFESSQRPKVRFAPQVAIRNIKARHNKGLNELDSEVTPQMFQALAAEGGDKSTENDSDGDGDDGDDAEKEDESSADSYWDEAISGENEADKDGQLSELVGDDGVPVLDEEEQRTAQRLAGDLFSDGDDEGGEVSSQVSAHERRLAQLQAEIKRLESENVGAKEWTLAGEASSRARPKDSLLEQDLEFEQSARLIPMIAAEKSEALEELIKNRILESRFDDVVPRRLIAQPKYRPDAELSDRKSGKSLAEEYEDEYRRASGEAGPEEFKSESERRLESDRSQISALMNDLFDKLDALSNAHFTPRAPKAMITTLSSAAPAISMEASTSVLPDTSQLQAQLAPQEIVEKKEIDSILRGDPSELTPEEKQILRRRKKRKIESQRKDRQQRRGDELLNAGAGKKVISKNAMTQKGGRREKEEATKKLLGMKGVTVVGKGDSVRGGIKSEYKGQDRKGKSFKL